MGAGSGASIIGILPLLAAGFIFSQIFYITRFMLAKADGQRLFFMCVIFGFSIGAVVFIVCAAIRSWLRGIDWLRDSMDWFHNVIPVPHGLTYLAAILTALALGYLANGVLVVLKKIKFPNDPRRVSVWAYWRSMSEHVTALDDLIRRAIASGSLVMICLKSRKVYCGIVAGVRGVHESAVVHIQIIPAFSITRDKDSLRFLPDTRTEYRAYILKNVFDRKVTLDGQIRNLAKLVLVLRKDESGPLADPLVKRAFMRSIRGQAGELIGDRKALTKLLCLYGARDSFDLTAWMKVIPSSEIESASLYHDDDYDKWFVSGEATSQADGT